MKKLMNNIINQIPYINRYSRINALGGIGVGLFLINFIFQRVLFINRQIHTQVHYTSRIIGENIKFNEDRNTILSFAVSGGVYIQSINGVIIKKDVMFAPGVKIVSANHNKDKRRESDVSKPIIIGERVWIGANAVILPGVEIADDCIIGAGTIVTKSFLVKNSIIVGNPAKKIN